MGSAQTRQRLCLWTPLGRRPSPCRGTPFPEPLTTLPLASSLTLHKRLSLLSAGNNSELVRHATINPPPISVNEFTSVRVNRPRGLPAVAARKLAHYIQRA